MMIVGAVKKGIIDHGDGDLIMEPKGDAPLISAVHLAPSHGVDLTLKEKSNR